MINPDLQIVLAYYILAIKSWFYLRILGRAKQQCLIILWPMRVGNLYLENCRLYICADWTVGGEVTILKSQIEHI